MSAAALACLPLFGMALTFLGCVMSISAAVRAGERLPCWPDLGAAVVAFALATLAFL